MSPAYHARLRDALPLRGVGAMSSAPSRRLDAVTPTVSRTRVPVLRRLADVRPEAVQWLWVGYVPLGGLTLLDGRPGQGKSTIALDLAARVSTGAPMPDGTPGLQGGVVYLSREDDPATTLRPRAEAAGADLDRIAILDGRATEERRDGADPLVGATEAVCLADVDVLREAVRTMGARLVVIDPVQSFLGRGVDAYRAEEVRPVLDGVAMLAREARCAVLILRHLRKSASDAAIDRGMGSVDFGAAARSMLLAGADPADETRRAVVSTKHSLAAEPPAIGYCIQTATIAAGIDTARVRWTGDTDMTAATILAPEPGADRPARGASEGHAQEWLREALAGGRRETWAALTREGVEAGHSEHTLRRARTALGCAGAWSGRDYHWTLPTERTIPSIPHGMRVGQDSKEPPGPTAARPRNLAQAFEGGQDSEALGDKAGGGIRNLAQPASHGGARPLVANRHANRGDDL